MLRVVTSNNPDLIGHFESRKMRQLGIEHTTAEHYVALEELVRTKRPEIAIVDAELRGGSGMQLCKRIRSNPMLHDVRVILILPSILGRADLEAANECGCDDVLTLPVTDDDLFHHIVSLSGRPQRRNERVAVELDIELELDSERRPAMAINMSLGGIGVRLDDPIEEGETVLAHMRHNGQKLEPARAVVAWARQVGGDHLAGLSFAEVPVDTKLLVEELCLFEVVESPLGGVRAYIHGDIIETTNLRPLAERLADANPVELNLREVRYISSVGTRHWVELLDALRNKRYWFRHASPAFVNQASLVPSMVGDGDVLSFEAPYLCEHCEREDVRLLDASAILRDGEELVPPTLRCPTCGGELIFDELPWRYFAFLRERP